MTGDAAAREATSSIGAITATALAIIALVLIANALLRGSSLDEYWTAELADRTAYGGFGPLFTRGWLHDTHPPLFNLWASLLTTIGVTSIPAARLLSNAPPLLMMIMSGSRLASRTPGETAFHAALLLLVLSVPVTVEAFGNYESYFWQVAALTMLVQIGRHIAMSDGDLRRRLDRDIIPIAMMASAGSIMLHYVGGILGVVLSLAIIFCAMAKGLRRWAKLLSMTVLISGVLTLACAYLQARHWASEIDHSWYEVEAASADAIVGGLILVALLHNPMPFMALKWVRDDWTKHDSAFVGMISGALAMALFLLFEINVEKPVIVEHYLAGLPVLICAVVAALAGKLAHGSRLFSLFAVVSVAVVLIPFLAHGPERRWQANAKQIGRIVANCPATEVYAASGWLLRGDAGFKTARRDDPIFARGYRSLGESRGFTPRMIGVPGNAQAISRDCPTLLWIEQLPPSFNLTAPRILAAVGLHGLENTRLTLLRSETGLIVRSDRQ
jgi:hypothetical protein